MPTVIRASPGFDALDLVDEDIPPPDPGQVLVRVRASSLNFRDPVIARGEFPFPASPGFIALSDGAGEIEAIGAGVTRFAVGDRVVNSFLPPWFGGKLREIGQQYVLDLDGWLAEYRVVSEQALVTMPAHLTFEEAATLLCTAVTAWTALAGLAPGDTILTQGSGSVSLFALQLAQTLGARVIAMTSTDEKARRLQKLGADAVINYVQTPEWSAAVLALTDGRGVDRVVEVGGSGTIAQSIKSVAHAGEIALVGMLDPTPEGMSLIDFFLSQSTLVKRYFTAIEEGDLTALDEIVSTDYQDHAPGRQPGREALKAAAQTLRVAFPDMTSTVTHMLAEGDLIAVRTRVTGTHHGPMGELPARGNRQLLPAARRTHCRNRRRHNHIERDAGQPPTHLEGRQGVQRDHRRSDRPARHPSRHASPSRAADRRRGHLCQARRHPLDRRDRIRRRRRRTTADGPRLDPNAAWGPVLDTEALRGSLGLS